MRIVLYCLFSLLFVCTVRSQTISPAGPLDLCPGGNQLLTVSGAVAGTTFQWQLNAVDIPGATLNTHSATIAGSYTAILTSPGPVKDTLGPVVLVSRPNPVAAFSFTPNNQCGNVPVSFLNTSTGTGLSYAWNFGDPASGANNLSSASQPTHRFVGNPGNGTQSFTVTLTVTSVYGCTATATATVTINQVPDLTLGGPGATVYDNKKYFRKCSNASTAQFDFTNQSTTIATNTFYQIVFGDASPDYTSATFPAPVAHNYSVGTYTLLFIVTGQNGCKDTATYYVFVGSNPAVGLGNPGNTAICTSSTLTFPISSTATNPPGTIYTVTFNDGTTPLTFSHPAPANISHTFLNTSCGTNSPPYPNSFSGTIQASNPCASSTATVVPIYVSQRPVADFVISPNDTICVNTITTITNTSGVANDIDNGTCVPGKFVWTITPATGWTLSSGALGNDFGLLDPTTWLTGSNTLNINFTTAGTYTIKLKLGNLNCGADSITRTICVNPSPTGSFTVNQNSGCAPYTVNTTSTANAALCGSNSYYWTVSYASTSGCTPTSSDYIYLNGTSNTSAQPQFQFNNPGIYTIGMVVISPAAACTSAIVTQTITVKSKPVVSLNSIPATLCQNQSITPSATVNCYINAATTYAWTFTGGTPASSTNANPGTISYNTPGTYTITLAVTNECGTTTVSTPVTVNPTPVPAVPANIAVCAGVTVGPLSFSSSTPGATFSWTNSNTSIGLLQASGTSNPIPGFVTTNTTTAPIISTINVTAALNGCSSSNSFSITVNPRPAAPTATSPVSYCQNTAAVPLTATANAGNTLLWYTTATGGTGSTTAPTPNTTTVGTTTYYVSQVVTATTCEGPRTPISVVINPSQVIVSATFINPATCSSLTGSITLNGLTPNTTYTVNYIKNAVPIAVSLTSGAGGVLIIPNLSAGTYTNIYVVLNGCPSNQVGPYTLVDPSAPATPTVTSNAPNCAGNTLSFSAATSTPGLVTYAWTGPNGFTSGIANPTIPNVTVAASGTYNVTATINGCTSAAGTVAVVVNATPALPTAGSNSPLCGAVGLSLNLTASTTFAGAVSYSWSGPGGFTSSLQNPVIPGVTTANAGTYTVIATANTGSCPSAPASTTITVNPTPTISGSSFSNPTSCGSSTGSITLNGLQNNTAYTVQYLINGSPVSIPISSNASGSLTIPGLTQGNYTNVSVVLNGCPSSPLTFTLTDPNPPATPVAGSNSPVCSGVNLSLQTATVAGASYAWTGPNGFTSTLQNPVIPNATTAASGNYTVTVTVSNCTSAPGTVSVLINQTPETPTAGSNSPLCGSAGATLNLTASTTTPGAITYSWTGPNSFTSAVQNPSILNVTTAMSGLYVVTATRNPGNCISAATNVPVVINPTPVITGTSSANPTNCGSASGTISLTGLTANTTYTVNYNWNGNPQSATILSNASGVLLINGLVQGTYTNIIAVLNGCPSAPAGPVVLADPNPPPAPTAGSNGPICSGTTLNLTASTASTGTISYAWTGPNGFTSNLQNPSIPNVTTAASGTYNVSVTVNDCVSPANSFAVLINPLPLAPVVTTPVNYCIGTTAVPLTANTLPGNTLNWYTTATGGTGTSTAPTPVTSIAGSTDYFVSQVNTATTCEGERAQLTVIINPDAIADFRPVDTIKCPPFSITSADIGLQTYPANNGVYEWYVNGTFIGSGTSFPGYTILNEDEMVTVTLKAISLFGCKPDSMSRNFYTYKLPHPSFTMSDTVGCGPLQVTFNNTSTNLALFNYTWNFGNGQISTLAQPGTIVFLPNPNSGDTTYIISLKIATICDTITYIDSVRVKAKPKAAFQPSITSGCSPMRVNFNNLSGGLNNTYYWDFGDGTTAITNNLLPVQHVYNTGSQTTYFIKLVAVNECGSDSITYSVVAAPNNINLNFTVNGPNLYGCAPHTVAFFNNSSGATNFFWNFGDGNTLNTTPNRDTVYHTYLLAGTFTVSLTAQNSCTDTTTTLQISVFPKPVASFIADRYTACIGQSIQFTNQSDVATSYLWQFGDGNTSTLLNPSHSYNTPGLYTVKLIIYRVNAPGNICIDSTTRQVQIVSGLPGSFSLSATTGSCVPFTVTFVNQNRPSVTAAWDFGDGNTGSGDSVLHTYQTAGIYTVNLTVTVPGGCTYTSQNTVTVNGPSGSLQYTGGFKCYPDPVRFEATAINTSNLTWNFGDGNTLTTTQLVVYHNYINPGTYIPSVTLQNAAGCNYFIPGIDTIKVDKIDAGFTATQQKYCGSTNVVFRDTSNVYFGKLLVKWDFGDGNTGTGTTVNHNYSITGNYTVQMIVIGNSGCTDTVTQQVNVFVNSLPVAGIVAVANGCTNQPVTFSGLVQGTDPINIYQWTISNGVNSSGQDFTYTFATPGIFTVRFITGTVNGCYDTATHTISISPSPVVTVTPSLSICLGNSVQLNASGATQFDWAPSQGLSCINCSNPVATPVITTPYVVTGTNSFGCTSQATAVVTVIQPLNMTTSENDTLCIGQSVNLQASGAASYTWTPAQGLNNPRISNPTASPVVTTTYRVVGYDGYNCFTDTAFIVVAVGQYPTVNLGPDKTLSTGTVLPLTSTVTNGPIRDWLWTPDNDLSCGNCTLPSALIKNDIRYVVNVTNIYGCSASDSINIKVFCTDAQVFIPNGFSPDGDGINDVLMVRGKGILSVKSFRIFNRWGEVVFEKINFPPNNPAYGWNGKIKGIEGPPDVFVYTAEVVCDNGTPYTYKGNVSLIK